MIRISNFLKGQKMAVVTYVFAVPAETGLAQLTTRGRELRNVGFLVTAYIQVVAASVMDHIVDPRTDDDGPKRRFLSLYYDSESWLLDMIQF